MGKGGIFVISGPSGAGKNTVYDGLCARSGDFAQTVSATTRAPRAGEQDGVDYYFKSADEFRKLVDAGEFIEYVNYGGNYYGTLKSEVARLADMGKKVVLVIEVNGAFNIKKAFPEAVLLFIMPPSVEELERRIRKRGDNTEEETAERIRIAEEEMRCRDRYDHCVVNDELDECVNNVYNIIMSKGE